MFDNVIVEKFVTAIKSDDDIKTTHGQIVRSILFGKDTHLDLIQHLVQTVQ